MIRLWKTTLKLRMLIGFIVILIFGGLLISRAFELQIIEGRRLRMFAHEQFHAKVYFTPERGNIYSSNGSILAASVNVPGIAVDPLMVGHKLKNAERLSELTGISFNKVIKILNRNIQFAWIKKRVSGQVAKNVEQQGISGVIIVKQPVRYYPNGTLLAHVLGFVGINDNGLSGIEYKYNNFLKGNKRALKILHDGLGQYIFIRGFGLRKATHGDNIYLTINKQLQFITQYYLDKEAKAADSKGAFAILMDPNTGAILAMADYPEFNPNYYWKYSARYWRNRAVTDDFEPGSTMKPFVVAAALMEGLVKPDTMIDCYHGSYSIDGITVHDVENWFGRFSVNQVVEYSSNVGECRIGMRFTKAQLYNWFGLWGFGRSPHAGLLGEAKGIIKPLNDWSEVGPCEMAFGQGISVTGLQEMIGLSAIANGGFIVKPYIIKKIVNAYGKVVYKTKLTRLKRIVAQKVDREVKYMMRLVVKGGTGQYAKLIDFKVSGKTGTGQIADPRTGKYYKNRYTASFMAFVPYKHPKLAMLVIQQEPSKIGYYGGAVSAPVVRDVFKNALNILNIYPGKNAYREQLKTGNNISAESGVSAFDINKLKPSLLAGNGAGNAVREDSGIMPDLKGDTIYNALKLLKRYKLKININGSGFLYYQSIKSGSNMGNKKTIILKFKQKSA
ncbi:MAG: penicillin-binding transpeptidase domain-containing protein [bacterium]